MAQRPEKKASLPRSLTRNFNVFGNKNKKVHEIDGLDLSRSTSKTSTTPPLNTPIARARRLFQVPNIDLSIGNPRKASARLLSNLSASKSMSDLSLSPRASVQEEREDNNTVKQWVNFAELHAKKGTLLEDSKHTAGTLHVMTIDGHYARFYRPPPALCASSFDAFAVSSSITRPSTAPASATENTSTIRHKSRCQHPELIVSSGNNEIIGGSLEAICHHMLLCEDPEFVEGVTMSTPVVANPAIVLVMILDLSEIFVDRHSRIALIIRFFITKMPGLFLEPSFAYNARILIEKSIRRQDDKLATEIRREIDIVVENISVVFDNYPEGFNVKEGPPLGTVEIDSVNIMNIQADAFAKNLLRFHYSFQKAWSVESDLSLLLQSPSAPPPSHVNPLVVTDNRPHFLTGMVLSQILEG